MRADLAKGLRSGTLAQAFWLYRSGGMMKPAMELAVGLIAGLIRPKGGMPGIVLDAVSAAKRHDSAVYENLLRKISETGPDMRVNPSGHAFLDREIRAALAMPCGGRDLI